MLRFLARARLLPFTGDRRYQGSLLWEARQGAEGGREVEVLERAWIDTFLAESRGKVRLN